MKYRFVESPVGQLLLAGDDTGVRHIRFPKEDQAAATDGEWEEDAGELAPLAEQLREYFAGDRRSFDLPLAPTGTPFQLEVWEALREIPYGERISYGELATRIGNPAAVRAVGAANGANPLPIVVPCHRVVGSTGKLVGFGGGLDIKRRLLDLEQGGSLFD